LYWFHSYFSYAVFPPSLIEKMQGCCVSANCCKQTRQTRHTTAAVPFVMCLPTPRERTYRTNSPVFANPGPLQVAGINEAEQKIAFALYYWVGIGGFAHKK
jgi:hypothetical protein